MKRLLCIFFIGTAMLMASEALANWIIVAERIGEEVQRSAKDAICSAANVPGMAQNSPHPTTHDHRFVLYLRCEAKGGTDEFAPNSCCDHLTSDDAKKIGVCPDRPVNVIVPIREAFRAFIQC